MSDDASGDVIFEITRIGDVQRVAAIHVASGTEVVIQAPASAALVDVRTLALNKLKRMMDGGGGGGQADTRPGKLV